MRRFWLERRGVAALMALVLALALALLAGPGEIRAQDAAGAATDQTAQQPADQAADQATEQGGAPHPPAEARRSATGSLVVDVLEDRATRHRLIPGITASTPKGAAPAAGTAASVSTGTGEGEVAGTAASIATGADQDSGQSQGSETVRRAMIGERVVSGLTTLINNVVVGAQRDWISANATARRLGGLARIDIEALGRLVPGFSLLLAVAFALVVAGNFLSARWQRSFGRAAGLSPGRRLLRGLAATGVDLLVVLAAVVGSAFGMSLLNAGDPQEQVLATFLGAYLVAGLLIVALKAMTRPVTRTLRPLPMTDRTALYWTRHLSALIVLVTFGEVLIRPLVTYVGTPITAQATVVTINSLALIWLMMLVFINRRAPVGYFEHCAARDEGNVMLAFLAAIMPRWYLLILVFLTFLLHQSLTSGEAGLPILIVTAQIAAALTLGLMTISLLSRFAEDGIKVSNSVRRTLPTLEGRLNAFVPPFLRLLRWVIFALWVGFVLQVMGTFTLWDWIEQRYGIDLIGMTTSLVVVVLGGFFAWLLVSSWVDYRLEPLAGEPASPREKTLLTLMRNAALIAILLVGLAVALSQIGVSVTPLLASAGVIGLAISFGSQRLMQDIITGIFIQFENVINVGDVVEAGGKIGAVEKLTIRSVSLRDVEGVLHMVPFSSVELVSNYMKGYSFHVADISIAYREDIDAAKAAMLDAYDDLARDPLMQLKLLGGVEWFGVQRIENSTIVLRARLKARPGEQWAVGRAYSELVKKRFDTAGIEIPLPQVTMWFGERREGPTPPAQLALAPTGDGKKPGRRRRRPAKARATRQSIRSDAPTDADGHGHDGDHPR